VICQNQADRGRQSRIRMRSAATQNQAARVMGREGEEDDASVLSLVPLLSRRAMVMMLKPTEAMPSWNDRSSPQAAERSWKG
jgi:hypothetical protein